MSPTATATVSRAPGTTRPSELVVPARTLAALVLAFVVVSVYDSFVDFQAQTAAEAAAVLSMAESIEWLSVGCLLVVPAQAIFRRGKKRGRGGMARARGDLTELSPGYRTEVLDEGTGRTVVLLHGTPFNLQAWDPLVGALAGRCRTVRFDARGHGASTAVPPGDYAQLASDVVVVMDRLDLPDAHVVGHSWGGQTAQQMALDHPERVNRLSLLCTRASPFPAFDIVATGVRDGTADKEASLARWFTPDELATPDSIVDAVRAWLRNADPQRWADALEMISAFDDLDRLHQVTVPTDVVAAGHDGVAVPEHMAEMAAALADASLTVLPETRHLLPLQHPDEIARILMAGA